MEPILVGTADRSIPVFIPDPASTDGSGKTGLVAANLTVSYTRVETDNDVVVTDVTSSLSDLTALTDAHTDWGLKEVSSTLAPGLYRLDIADAVFAAGAWYAVVYVMITTSAAAATPKAFRLDATDLDSIKADTAAILVDTAEIGAAGAGLTNINLPNQTMDITGNITGNLSGSVGSVTGAVGSVTGAVGSVTGNVGGNVVGSVASVTAGVTLAVSAVQAIWDALTSALTTVGSIGKLLVDRLDAAMSSRASQTTADTDHDLTQANIAALNNLSAAQVATELATYDAPTKAELDAAVAPLALETTAQSVLADTGTDGVVVAAASKTGYALTSAYDPAKTAAQAGDAMALTAGERNSAADALLARTLGAESYATDGAVPTVAQMLFMLWSGLVEFSITGTTLTCKKLDGSTTAMTFTLDDASAPTSRTRAT